MLETSTLIRSGFTSKKKSRKEEKSMVERMKNGSESQNPEGNPSRNILRDDGEGKKRRSAVEINKGISRRRMKRKGRKMCFMLKKHHKS